MTLSAFIPSESYQKQNLSTFSLIALIFILLYHIINYDLEKEAEIEEEEPTITVTVSTSTKRNMKKEFL